MGTDAQLIAYELKRSLGEHALEEVMSYYSALISQGRIVEAEKWRAIADALKVTRANGSPYRIAEVG